MSAVLSGKSVSSYGLGSTFAPFGLASLCECATAPQSLHVLGVTATPSGLNISAPHPGAAFWDSGALASEL